LYDSAGTQAIPEWLDYRKACKNRLIELVARLPEQEHIGGKLLAEAEKPVLLE
jgi:hypothetical protein